MTKEKTKTMTELKDYSYIDKEFILDLFKKPKIYGVIADVNSGKSMLLYNIIEQLSRLENNLVVYGLRANLPCEVSVIYSIEELEKITNSIIIIDEFFSLFELDNRKKTRIIEQTLRLINHNNNVLILAGTGENFKKFISNKLDGIFFKKVSLGDLINGSRVKNICTSYKGYELGSSILNIPIEKCLYYDGITGSFKKKIVDYLEEYDSKLANVPIVKEIVDENKLNMNKEGREESKISYV